MVHPSVPASNVSELIAHARFSPNTPEQFAAFVVKGEIAKWAPVVKASGARVD